MIVGLLEQLGYTSNDLNIPFLMSSKSWFPRRVSCFFRPLTSDQSYKTMAYSFPQTILGLQGQVII